MDELEESGKRDHLATGEVVLPAQVEVVVLRGFQIGVTYASE